MNTKKSHLQTILKEASNPNTHPERLKIIYTNYKYKKIKKALTSNPNTPLNILIDLARYYPAQFLENIALDLHLLKNPNLLAEIPKESLISILKLSQTPEEFIFFALNHCLEARIFKVILTTHSQLWNEWRKNNYQKKIGFGVYLVYLHGAYLNGINLACVDLRGADLSNTNLSNSVLDYAKLSRANLTNAKLTGANLTGANLTGANLTNAKLTGANLTNANLSVANLNCANLTEIKINKSTIIEDKWLNKNYTV